VFLNTVFEFLIVAFVIFLMVRQLNRLKTPAPAPPTEDARDCPFCVSRISSKATRRPHCPSELGPSRK
jgi:large conductance mechanosensitive channel